MKALIVLLAVLALLWLLRGAWRNRGRRPPNGSTTTTRQQPSAAPRPMLTCAHCGVHLPLDDALPGRGGVFCDETHRIAYEAAHPVP